MTEPLPVTTIEERKRELVRVYTTRTRVVIAFSLIHIYGFDDLTKQVLDRHTVNVVKLILREIDVTGPYWPPSPAMDDKVDVLVAKYLRNATKHLL